MAVSCTTAYDSQGRPQTVVTPEGALLGAVAAGVLAYQLGKDNDDKHYGHHGGYHGGHHYGGRHGRCRY